MCVCVCVCVCCLSIHLFISLYIYLSIYLSIYRSIYMYLSITNFINLHIIYIYIIYIYITYTHVVIYLFIYLFHIKVSAFVSVMALDAKRQRANRLDFFLWCLQLPKSILPSGKERMGLLHFVMKKFVSVAVLNRFFRPLWVSK